MSLGTEAIRIPVAAGQIDPPKKRVNQRKKASVRALRAKLAVKPKPAANRPRYMHT